MGNILLGAKGKALETEQISGPNPYPNGGFSHRTNLGVVTHAHVEVDDAQWEARATGFHEDNAVVIQVYSQASGGELGDGVAQDLSGDNFTVTSYRL